MKKLNILLVSLFFISSTSFLSAQTQSGQWYTKTGDPGYNLDASTGERSTTIEVAFVKPFDAKPKVVVSVSLLDADKNFNSRYNVEVISISRDGFTIKIKTWADTKILGIGGYWFAYKE